MEGYREKVGDDSQVGGIVILVNSVLKLLM